MEGCSPWVAILRVSDGRKSARFYADAPGLELDWEHRFGDDFPLYIQISRPPLVLHLSEHQGTAAGPSELFVRVPEVDAVHESMLGRGEPATHCWQGGKSQGYWQRCCIHLSERRRFGEG